MTVFVRCLSTNIWCLDPQIGIQFPICWVFSLRSASTDHKEAEWGRISTASTCTGSLSSCGVSEVFECCCATAPTPDLPQAPGNLILLAHPCTELEGFEPPSSP